MTPPRPQFRYLLSLPPHVATHYVALTHADPRRWFASSDPQDRKVGSGGGTVWLIRQEELARELAAGDTYDQRRIIIHAGGESRRLPAYAACGKLLTPAPHPSGVPLLRTLVDVLRPLLDNLMTKAPASLTTLVVSGDVIVDCPALPEIPEADIVCMGLYDDYDVMKNHGVFCIDRQQSDQLDFMLQKPSVEHLAQLESTHLCLMDVGLWLLSPRAMQVLAKKSTGDDGNICFYDLYGSFGGALGSRPVIADTDLQDLTVAIVPLTGGTFRHFGSSADLMRSAKALTGNDTGIFTLNAKAESDLSSPRHDIWIENACVPATWSLVSNHIITGVPENAWKLALHEGQCIDMVPVDNEAFVVRPYGFNDLFRGAVGVSGTRFMNRPFIDWMQSHGIDEGLFAPHTDLQEAKLFPVCRHQADMERILQWFVADESTDEAAIALWTASERLSASDIALRADLPRLLQQRREHTFAQLRSAVTDEARRQPQWPHPTETDRTTETRAESPVRIDLAGGWTDTPPYALICGGNVVNMGINLNGQAPLKACVRTTKTFSLVCRSIDLDATEEIRTYDALARYDQVGSPFSIPKAALALAGFLPSFSHKRYASLHEQLEDFGSGLEVTLHSNVPAGSGLGTSSILAATVLGALNRHCHLGWTKEDIGQRTLALEQMLTTGGGWQDQFGGLTGGVKLLMTRPGIIQTPATEPLSELLYHNPDTCPCHLLYYTGITRTAKHILTEIVENMFRGDPETLDILDEMKQHARNMAQAIRTDDFTTYGQLVRHTWELNCRLDSGTCPPPIEALCRVIDDLCLGYKLPGAGGGGFMYMVAKDITAANRLKEILTATPLTTGARFFDMDLSTKGLSVTTSQD